MHGLRAEAVYLSGSASRAGVNFRTRSLLVIFLGGGLLAGCANIPQQTSRETVLCPQCRSKAVAEATEQIRSRFPYSRRAGANHVTACTGCHGVIDSLVRERRWEHKCSICARAPYRCPEFLASN